MERWSWARKKVAVVIFDEKIGNDCMIRQKWKSGLFLQDFIRENEKWTKINVHFFPANHFLCFDKYMILRTYVNII
jgi:hypothetical protein